MLLRMIELGMKIDRIVFADTGFEFPELYKYIDRIEKYIGRKIERLNDNPLELFKKWMYGGLKRGPRKGQIRGFPLTVFKCWWTREAKIKPLAKVAKGNSIMYVGIAFDERKRCSDVNPNLRYPLVDWGWSEQDCVDYLNKKRMLNPLYKNFNRLGCWLCPKQNMNSFYTLYKLYPKLWKQLKWWDKENKRIRGDTILLNPMMILMP